MRIAVSFKAMHELNYFREHLEVFAEMAKKRGAVLDLEAFRKLDKERRELITATEHEKAQRNRASEEIARLKKEKQNADALIAEMKQVSDQAEAGAAPLDRVPAAGGGDEPPESAARERADREERGRQRGSPPLGNSS